MSQPVSIEAAKADYNEVLEMFEAPDTIIIDGHHDCEGSIILTWHDRDLDQYGTAIYSTDGTLTVIPKVA